MWVKYSGGKFGYTVQKQIYDQVDNNYGKFCEQVGWLTYNPHNASQYLIFKLNAPLGHLPSRIWVTGLKWWRHTEVMGARLSECELS